MSVNLSIKNVPDAIAERLRMQAARNHRSLQGELMSILEKAVEDEARDAELRERQSERKLSLREVAARIREMGLSTPSESADIVREDRDRDGR